MTREEFKELASAFWEQYTPPDANSLGWEKYVEVVQDNAYEFLIQNPSLWKSSDAITLAVVIATETQPEPPPQPQAVTEALDVIRDYIRTFPRPDTSQLDALCRELAWQERYGIRQDPYPVVEDPGTPAKEERDRLEEFTECPIS